MATTNILQGFGFASYPVSLKGLQQARDDAAEVEADLRAIMSMLGGLKFSPDVSLVDAYIDQVSKALHQVNLAFSDMNRFLKDFDDLLKKVVEFHQQLTKLIKDTTAAARRMQQQARDAAAQNFPDQAQDLLAQADDAIALAEAGSATQRALLNELQLTYASSRALVNMGNAVRAESAGTVARLKAAQKTAVSSEQSQLLQRSLEINERLLKELQERQGMIGDLVASITKIAKGAVAGMAGIVLLLAAAWAVSMRPRTRRAR